MEMPFGIDGPRRHGYALYKPALRHFIYARLLPVMLMRVASVSLRRERKISPLHFLLEVMMPYTPMTRRDYFHSIAISMPTPATLFCRE